MTLRPRRMIVGSPNLDTPVNPPDEEADSSPHEEEEIIFISDTEAFDKYRTERALVGDETRIFEVGQEICKAISKLIEADETATDARLPEDLVAVGRTYIHTSSGPLQGPRETAMAIDKASSSSSSSSGSCNSGSPDMEIRPFSHEDYRSRHSPECTNPTQLRRILTIRQEKLWQYRLSDASIVAFTELFETFLVQYILFNETLCCPDQDQCKRRRRKWMVEIMFHDLRIPF